MNTSQSHLGERRKQSLGKKEEGTWVGAGSERGSGNMIRNCEGCGGGLKPWGSAENNGNIQPQEVGYRGPSRRFQRPRRWETPRTQRERETLDKVLYSGEGELVESTSSGGTGIKWRCCPICIIFDPELFLFEGTAGTKLEKNMKERMSTDRPN